MTELGMTLSDIDAFIGLDLQFTSELPVDGEPGHSEHTDYLVLGKIECPNGFVGPQFMICTYLDGEWYFAPDGMDVKGGVPMWDGSDGTTHAPFTPIKWAKLPLTDEE